MSKIRQRIARSRLRTTPHGRLIAGGTGEGIRQRKKRQHVKRMLIKRYWAHTSTQAHEEAACGSWEHPGRLLADEMSMKH